MDNLDNSFELAIERVAELAGDKAGNMKFVKMDLRDYDALDAMFASEKYVIGMVVAPHGCVILVCVLVCSAHISSKLRAETDRGCEQ